MPDITITINLDNAAFFTEDNKPNPGPEVARILRRLADQVETDPTEIRSYTLHDLNGNKVGTLDQ